MDGGPVQEEEGRPGGQVQNISDVRGGGTGLSACSGKDTLESSRTRDYLPVKNSLRHKTHILFLWL